MYIPDLIYIWPLSLTQCFSKHLLHTLQVMSFDFMAGHVFHILAFLIHFSLEGYFTTIFVRFNTVMAGRRKKRLSKIRLVLLVGKIFSVYTDRVGFAHFNLTKLNLRTPASPALSGTAQGPSSGCRDTGCKALP